MSQDDLLPTRRSLLSRLRNWDDQESWQEFFDTYWRLIYSAGIRAGLNEQDAEEVVQDTVVAVVRKMPDFKYDPATCSFKTWLWLVTRRTLATGEVYGVLRSLYVRPAARGAGVGAQLAHYASRYFQERGVTRVVATVHSQNLPGLRTLAKAGFQPAHTMLEWRP